MKKKEPIHICANVIVRKNDEILLALRGNTRFAPGYYGIISGGVKAGESIREAAIRELDEKIGIGAKAADLRFYTLIHSQEKDGIHMSTFFIVDRWEGAIENKVPEKHKTLTFFPLDQLPKKLIPYVEKGLSSLVDGRPHCYYKEYRWDR